MSYRKQKRADKSQRRFRRAKAVMAGMLWLSGSMTTASASPAASIVASPISRTYSIAPMHYNRLAVKSDRIVSVRGEESDCQIESDPQTGDVYILPLTQNPFRVFVTTSSGETTLVTLTPTAKETQNIVVKLLKPVANMGNTAWRPQAEPQQYLQKQAASIIKGRIPDGVVISNRHAPRLKSKSIVLSPTHTYRSNRGDWVVYLAKNRCRHDLSLNDWEWLPQSAKAVMSNDPTLKSHGTTKVVIFWAKG